MKKYSELLGVSTGALYKFTKNEYERIELLREHRVKVVELGLVKGTAAEIKDLACTKLTSFDYLSLHAPIFPYAYDLKSLEIIDAINWLDGRCRQLDLVVFHPDQVRTFEALNDVIPPITIENMDNRKQSHKAYKELSWTLGQNPMFALVLDLNHAYSNDPAMPLVNQIAKYRSTTVEQIHISGYDGGHVPLFKTNQVEIIHAVKKIRRVPIIIESVFDSIEDMKREMDYILSILGD